ncbi:MAG: hypothetical protein C6I05_05910 [Epsilonproteobacteria bacterium]|nr:hypothetical protein [Campylobacterota bacterium]
MGLKKMILSALVFSSFLLASPFKVYVKSNPSPLPPDTRGGNEVKFDISSVDIKKYPKVGLLYSGIPDHSMSNVRVYQDGNRVEVESFDKGVGTGSGLDIVLVVDISGSMGFLRNLRLYYDKNSRMYASQVALINFLDSLSPYDRVGLVTFSDYAEKRIELTTDKELVKSVVEQLEPEDSTFMFEGASLAIDLLKASTGRKIVLLFSDGETYDGEMLDEVVAEAKQNGVIFYTVALGYNNVSDEGKEYLRELAKQTGGEFYVEDNGEAYKESDPSRRISFDQLYSDITQNIKTSQYKVVFNSPSDVPEKEHQVVLKIDVGSTTYVATTTYKEPTYVKLQLEPSVQVLLEKPVPENRPIPVSVEVEADPQRIKTGGVILHVKSVQEPLWNNGFTVTMSPSTTRSLKRGLEKMVFTATIPAEKVKRDSQALEFYITIEDTQGFVHTLPENNPEEFPFQIPIVPNQKPEIDHTPVNKVDATQNLSVEGKVRDDTLVKRVLLYYRNSLKNEYDVMEKEINSKESEFSFVIPNTVYNSAPGVDYYLLVEDGQGLREFSGTPEDPHRVVVLGSSGSGSTGDKCTLTWNAQLYRGWNLLGTGVELKVDELVSQINTQIALNPQGKNMRVRSVYVFDALNQSWKFWIEGRNDNTLSVIEPNQGFWLYID